MGMLRHVFMANGDFFLPNIGISKNNPDREMKNTIWLETCALLTIKQLVDEI